MSRPTIEILGCGAKSAAIHVLSHVLQRTGRASLDVRSTERQRTAAHWDGGGGWTDGAHRLGTSPLKDLVFPGRTLFGAEVDRNLHSFTWCSFLADRDGLADWVDRGCPAPTHRHWADYLRWAIERSGARVRRGEVVRVVPRGGGVRVFLSDGRSFDADGFVYTGPGEPRRLLPQGKRDERVFDGRDFWSRHAHVPGRLGGRVAIVGRGETAAAILQCLAPRSGDLELTLVTRDGLLPTRDECHAMNRWYSHPEDWVSLPEPSRRAVIAQGDRGVVSVSAQRALAAHAVDLRVLRGEFVRARTTRHAVELIVRTDGRDRVHRFDFAVSAMGFDLLGPLARLLDPAFGLPADPARWELRVDHHLRLPTTVGNVHVPGLAGLAQGPGFPNLSCLASLAERVLSVYVESPPRVGS